MNLLAGRMFGSEVELSVRNYILGLSERSDFVEQYLFKQFGYNR